MIDKITLTGHLDFVLFNKVTGEKTHYHFKNLIVNSGLSKLALLASGALNNNFINQIGFGTNSTAPTTGDTTLTGSYVKAIDSVTVNASQVVVNWSLGDNEYNGITIYEMGLLTGDDTLFNRAVNTGIQKTSANSLSGTWTLNF
jgi:hypothetical protein